MSGANKTSTKRPSREEIVDLFRACAAKNEGIAPGKRLFQETCGITEAQVKYCFWRAKGPAKGAAPYPYLIVAVPFTKPMDKALRQHL